MTENKAFQWLRKAVGRQKYHILMLVFLQTIVSGGSVCYALIMKDVIDAAVAKNRHGFFVGLALFAMVIVVLLVLRVALRYLGEATRSGLENTLKKNLFHSLLLKDYAQVTAIHSEEWMNRITSDTAVCANGMTDILPGAIGMAVKMGGALVMIFLLQPLLACIMIPCGILFLLVTIIFRKYLKLYHKRMQEKDGLLRVYFQERISSMLILRTFGAEETAMQGADVGLEEHKKARIKKGIISNLCNTGFSAAMNGMYLVGVGYCGYGILVGSISYGTLTAITQLIGQLQTPLAGISGYVPRYYSMLASAERLMEVEAYQEADIYAVKSIEETKQLYHAQMKKIDFEQVSFSYQSEPNNSLILENIDLSINKGDYIAFTGLSGCGKSTLLKLLMGVYNPDAGTIHIRTTDDQILPIKEWRKLFAYVPQGNYLMGGTIREVITFDNQTTSNGSMTIEKALELACADFVWELPEGVETLLGEKGAGLSEGQMQRIAIARALYADAPILILDEATSALDEQTEKKFLEKMKQLTDKTVLIVTHRSAALDICNRQFCFSNGEIVFDM